MTARWKARRRRRRLAAHDRGDNRHDKGVAFTRKKARVAGENPKAHTPPKHRRET